MTRSWKSKVLIIALNSMLVAAWIITAWVFRDQCEQAIKGREPLGLVWVWILNVPCLIVLGIILVFLQKKLELRIINLVIPFAGILVYYLPLVLNGATPAGQGETVSPYWRHVEFMGIGFSAALSAATLVITLVTLLTQPAKDKYVLSSDQDQPNI